MKNLRNVLVILTLVLFTACDQSKSAPSDDTAVDTVSLPAENEVAAAVDSLSRAIVDPEEALLEKITADKLTYGHSSGLVQNKDEFIDDLINGDFDFSSVKTPDQKIYIEGKTAIVRHIFTAEATNAGEPIDIRLGTVLVYQKQNGQWKLLARQAFKL